MKWNEGAKNGAQWENVFSARARRSVPSPALQEKTQQRKRDKVDSQTDLRSREQTNLQSWPLSIA